ncbi:MAG: NAD(P)/FAD-dependent oxidoreductase [Ostreibacterium sp.]
MQPNTHTIPYYDAVIIGAGAAGLMCAIRAGERRLSVLILDKAEQIGQKILISGGGRCNFTNLNITPEAYLSPNPHFCKSALSRYTQWHFIELLKKYGLTYTEKTLGQLFCQQKSKALLNMLISEIEQHDIPLKTGQFIKQIQHNENGYIIDSNNEQFLTPNLVIATGGPSIPKIGGSDFALRIAKQFDVKNTPFSPALVPLILPELLLSRCKPLAGISHKVRINCHNASFIENLLFTHRGLSGPAILQISSYWKKGDTLNIDLLPERDIFADLKTAKTQYPQQTLHKALSSLMPSKLASVLTEWFFTDHSLQWFDDKSLANIARQLHNWKINPSGSEGMKKAEVSIGGIHPDALSSKTLESSYQGLHFIGESVDVTGWLGGYNFQWAWSSGWCCGDSLKTINSFAYKKE